jgi:hypothetical protein
MTTRKRPLDFACYTCRADVGVFCTDPDGRQVIPHKMRTRAAALGEVRVGLKISSTKRSRRAAESGGGKANRDKWQRKRAEVAASLPPEPRPQSVDADVIVRRPGSCTGCDEFGHRAPQCPKRRAS